MSKLNPKYTIWEAIQAALAVGTKALQEVRDLARIPGPPGKDGVGFDDLKFFHDGERKITFRFEQGERVLEKTFTFPVMIYRGVFREGEGYEQGDVCTWGGHAWHCDTTTKDKPDGKDRCWTMMIRKPRDGKDYDPLVKGKA